MSHIATSSGPTGNRFTPSVLQTLELRPISFAYFFSSSSLNLLVPLILLSVFLYSLSSLPFYFPLLLPLCLHHSFFSSAFISCFVSTAPSLPLCLPSQWIHINNSLHASGPAGLLKYTLVSMLVCSGESNRSSLMSLLCRCSLYTVHKPPASYSYV